MLVLSRKKNESIVVNNDITITVVEIRGDKVRLGIVAPKETPVHRQEIFEAIHGRPSTTLGYLNSPPSSVLGNVFEAISSIFSSSPGRARRPTRGKKISVAELVDELGGGDAEAERPVRFTSEGGINSPAPRRRR
jgi:carbon storage regulator